MSLLQIHDPSGSPRPVGIDLGTTNSLIAWVPPTGQPTVIEDCDGKSLVPSVVHFAESGRILVGEDAQQLAAAFPEDTIVSVKRFMGRGADDPEVLKLGPYRFATNEGPVVRFELSGKRVVTPVEVSAEILRELRDRAHDEIGEVGGAVITVPAYFDDAQRQATRDAARLAGLEVLRLLNEPTAAALAYGLDSKRNGLFVVYDLGGGTFDVTVLRLDDGVFQVQSTGGDSQLGGDDMDRALVELLTTRLSINDQSPRTIRQLLDAARELKHRLSAEDRVVVELELGDHGKILRAEITRLEFEAAVAPIVERTGVACRRALRDASVRVAELDGVILVGGATRTPAVRRYVTELFGLEPLAGIDPDRVVAIGAAVQADLLAGTGPKQDILLLDVLPLSLGVETMGGVVEKILPRNTTIPAAAAQNFTTYADNQTGFELHVVQGERELATQCRSLARFTLRGIPPMAAGIARLQVRFAVDANGLLSVSAREERTGVEQTIEVKPSYGLTDEQVEQMLLDAYEHGETDVKERVLRERLIEGERVLLATHKAIAQDADLLTDPAEKLVLEQSIAALVDAMTKREARLIATRLEELDAASKGFAGRRMDRAIGTALRGRDVGALETETHEAKGIESHLGPAGGD